MPTPAPLSETADVATALPRYNDSAISMDTLVAIEVVGAPDKSAAAVRVRTALGWFDEVEARCSRFDANSELADLCSHAGEAVTVSPLLFHVLELALQVARASGGAYDPTVGSKAIAAGFATNYRGGNPPDLPADPGATFRDVELTKATRAVRLRKPLLLDLGGVAKGFAIDLAAAELASFRNFAINAGGDIFVGGHNADGGDWRIGIRNPFEPRHVLGAVEVSGVAVCTSGGYERPRPSGGGHHLIEPWSGGSPSEVASVTTVGPTAALCDALSTAAFVLGPRRGKQLLKRAGIEGLFVAADGTISKTSRFPGFAA